MNLRGQWLKIRAGQCVRLLKSAPYLETPESLENWAMYWETNDWFEPPKSRHRLAKIAHLIRWAMEMHTQLERDARFAVYGKAISELNLLQKDFEGWLERHYAE